MAGRPRLLVLRLLNRRRWFLFLLFIVLLYSANSFLFSADIVLNNDFIEQYKDMVLIDGTFSVAAVPDSPHSISSSGNDGDIHASGLLPAAGFTLVAEVMNAAKFSNAVTLLQQNQQLQIKGVWRLWCEHAGSTPKFTQGNPAAIAAGNTNPNHVFEVHPITTLKSTDLLDSITTIPGYSAYDETKFTNYQKKKLTIIPGQSTTTLRTTEIGYNYVKFRLQILDEPQNQLVVPGEGRFVFASILKKTGHKVVLQKRRMVFIEGTQAETVLKNAHAGGMMVVLGIPRVDLSVVSWRVNNPTWHGQNTLRWNLPYEMIIVGVY